MTERILTVTTEDVDMDSPSSEIEGRDIADPPMEDPESEDDSKEMRILKAKGLRKVDRRIHPSHLQSLQIPSPWDIAPVKAGTELMRAGFTVNSALPRYYLAVIDSVAR